MLEPVGNKDGLAIGCLDDVLQCIQLTVMHGGNAAIIRVDCAVCHLAELAGEGGGIGGCDLTLRELQHKVMF